MCGMVTNLLKLSKYLQVHCILITIIVSTITILSNHEYVYHHNDQLL